MFGKVLMVVTAVCLTVAVMILLNSDTLKDRRKRWTHLQDFFRNLKKINSHV